MKAEGFDMLVGLKVGKEVKNAWVGLGDLNDTNFYRFKFFPRMQKCCGDNVYNIL